MRSKSLTIRVPQPLREIMEERAVALGYPTVSAYMVGLLRYDIMTQKPHAMTSDLAKLSLCEQDRVDDELAALWESKEGLNGSWFEACLARALAKGKDSEESPATTEALRRIVHQ